MFCVLSILLCVSLTVNLYLFYLSQLPATAKIFNFHWNVEYQNVVDGTLCMNVTFEWINGNLSVVVEVNDDDYHSGDSVGLFFDRNRDGTIDHKDMRVKIGNRTVPLENILIADGMATQGALISHRGKTEITRVISTRNGRHVVTYSATGYVFQISYTSSELNFTEYEDFVASVAFSDYDVCETVIVTPFLCPAT